MPALRDRGHSWNVALLGGEPSDEDFVLVLDLLLRRDRGKLALGGGDQSIGGRLPGRRSAGGWSRCTRGSRGEYDAARVAVQEGGAQTSTIDWVHEFTRYLRLMQIAKLQDVDLDKARSLLAEAGYADGLELKIHYIPGPNEQQLYVAEYIALALAEVGVDAEVVQSADLPSWAGIFFGGPDAWHMTMNAYFNWGDPVIGVHRIFLCANAIKSFFVNNSEYCNETVDQLLNDAAQEQDFEARKELYAEAQEITAEELPLYFINTLPIFGAIQPDVMNVPTGPWGYLSGMQDVWLDR